MDTKCCNKLRPKIWEATKEKLEYPAQKNQEAENDSVEEWAKNDDGNCLSGEQKTALVVEDNSMWEELKPIIVIAGQSLL